MGADDHPDVPAPDRGAEAAAAEATAGAAAAEATAGAAAAEATAGAAAARDARAEQLCAAVDHFVAGNFAAARQVARGLLRGDPPPELRTQADELLHRMGLDPVALWIAIGSTIFFVVVVVLTYRR
jgi:hypothetical protein